MIFNTPSKLTCFLEAAEKNGIPGVQSYHATLSLKAYGPDILHLVNNADLAEVGISPGDAIRLKEYASMWWMNEQQRVAKHPRELGNDHRGVSIPLPAHSTTPLNKRLRFEKHYHKGGGMSISGRDIAKAASDYNGHDHSWWVYSKELKMFIPLPAGKVPVIDDYPIPLASSEFLMTSETSLHLGLLSCVLFCSALIVVNLTVMDL